MVGAGSYIGRDVTLLEGVSIGRNAVLEGSIVIGANARVGNGVIIDGDYTIGSGTTILDHSTIYGSGEIGENNWIGPHTTIGTPAQHTHKSREDTRIFIGNNNVIREYTTIHLPFVVSETRVGNGCYIMAYCHIAHDCVVGNGVILANQTTLGGHTLIQDNANLGLGVLVHQYCQVGYCAMIAMGGVMRRDVLPFSMLVNERVQKLNVIGLARHGISEEDIRGINAIYHKFNPQIQVEDQTWYGILIHNFCANSRRGFYYPDADWWT